MIRYRQAHPDWVFVRHEDLSLAPLEQFHRLYDRLGLEYTEHAQQVIKSFSSRGNPSDTDAQVGSEEILKRDSVSNIWNWKKRLSTEEIEKIHGEVDEISRAFYDSEDW
jgi:hypothetical protein